MVQSPGGSKKAANAALLASLIGLWPIIGLLVIWALAQWGAGQTEFSLDPKDTSRTVIAVLVGLALTLILALGALVVGLRGAKKGAPARGRSTVAAILGAVGTLFLVGVVVFGLILKSQLPGTREDKLSKQQRLEKCRTNQKNIATMLGPEMYGFDHPDAKPEDLKKLDLSPKGDLMTGPIAYTTDKAVLDCPCDDDPNDIDYAVEITPEGEIKVRCIDPKGVKEGHNAP